MNIGNLKTMLAVAVAAVGMTAVADPTVTVGEVENGEPWSTITVNYILGGTDAKLDYKVAFDVTAGGQTASVTNDAAKLTDGATNAVIDTVALFGRQVADTRAKVKVTLIAVKPKLGGVQLWAGGPYFAECNVGATKPEEYGWYFWWGDTVGYERNADSNGWVSVVDGTTSIKFSSSDATASQTYQMAFTVMLSEGWSDASGNLTMEHDAARAKLGEPWRMMTKAEADALVANCTTVWTNNWNGTGVNGRLVTGNTDGYTDKSIFFPAAGMGSGSSLNYSGEYGFCWSSNPYRDDNAWFFLYSGSRGVVDEAHRYEGRSVRPVRGFAE